MQRAARPFLLRYALVLLVVLVSPTSGTQSGLVVDVTNALHRLGF